MNDFLLVLEWIPATPSVIPIDSAFHALRIRLLLITSTTVILAMATAKTHLDLLHQPSRWWPCVHPCPLQSLLFPAAHNTAMAQVVPDTNKTLPNLPVASLKASSAIRPFPSWSSHTCAFAVSPVRQTSSHLLVLHAWSSVCSSDTGMAHSNLFCVFPDAAFSLGFL